MESEEKLDNKSLITLVVLFLTLLQGMGIDIYAPSLPHIVTCFSADPALVKLAWQLISSVMRLVSLSLELSQMSEAGKSLCFGEWSPI